MSFSTSFKWKGKHFTMLSDGAGLYVYEISSDGFEESGQNILEWDEDFDSPTYGLITDMLMSYKGDNFPVQLVKKIAAGIHRGVK